MSPRVMSKCSLDLLGLVLPGEPVPGLSHPLWLKNFFLILPEKSQSLPSLENFKIAILFVKKVAAMSPSKNTYAEMDQEYA